MIHHMYKETQAQDYICDYEAQGDLLPTTPYRQSDYVRNSVHEYKHEEGLGLIFISAVVLYTALMFSIGYGVAKWVG